MRESGLFCLSRKTDDPFMWHIRFEGNGEIHIKPPRKTMKRDYEIDENNEINESFQVFRLFRFFRLFRNLSSFFSEYPIRLRPPVAEKLPGITDFTDHLKV